MGRARIVYFVPYLSVGGVERQLQVLATRLDPSRFEPIVCCPCAWGPIGTELREAGVPVIRLPYSSNAAGVRERAHSWFRQVKADIFHSFEYHYTDYAGGWQDISLARLAGIPVCLAARSDLRYWAAGAPTGEAEDARNRLTDRIICNSAAVADACAQFEGVHGERIRIIRNGVVLPRQSEREWLRPSMRFPDDTLLVGCVANLRPIKDYATLVAAFRKVVECVPNARLVICGRGPSAADVERYIAAAELRDRVVMLGFRGDMTAVYRALDLSVQSSRSEGLPNAVLEAMAHGLPVVATDVGGTREAIEDGITGTLVPPADPDRLAEEMLRYLQDPGLRARAGAAGRRRAADLFSVDRMVRSHEDLYEECLAKARPIPAGRRRGVPDNAARELQRASS